MRIMKRHSSVRERATFYICTWREVKLEGARICDAPTRRSANYYSEPRVYLHEGKCHGCCYIRKTDRIEGARRDSCAY